MDVPIIAAYLVATVAIAWGCARIATRKGRSAGLWAVLGVVFPLAALISIAVLPVARRDDDRL